MKLLYRTAEWHGLAKLRMHTEGSLDLMEELTKELGFLLRDFSEVTCKEFRTYELPREVQERQRRVLARDQTSQGTRGNDPNRGVHDERGTSQPTQTETTTTPSTSITQEAASTSNGGRREKTLNLFTVKFHFLGDYVRSIRLFGTTDSYSTQIVSTIFMFGRIFNDTYHVCRESLLIVSSKDSTPSQTKRTL